jgi:cytochrome c-type biogenesis protein CcmE
MTFTLRQQRFALITGGVLVLALAAAFVLNAFQSNLVFFFTPTQVLNNEAPKDKIFRIGGLVKVGSLQRDGTTVSFVVTDTAQDIAVSYTGLLPDLFKEGKGVVAQGRLDEKGQMTATEVLAKHDENYMPPEAQHALDKAAQARTSQSVKP